MQKNKKAEQKQTHRYREHFDGCQRGGGLEGWMQKVKGLKCTNGWLPNSHKDVKDSIGNPVNDTVTTVYGVREELDLSR